MDISGVFSVSKRRSHSFSFLASPNNSSLFESRDLLERTVSKIDDVDVRESMQA